MWDWSLTSGPAQEPITVQDAKDHARITHGREDGLIAADITAARQAFESFTNRAAMTQTWTLQLRGFADVMPLPMAAAAFQVVMMAAARGLGPIDDAAFVKVYEEFTGRRIAPDDSPRRNDGVA